MAILTTLLGCLLAIWASMEISNGIVHGYLKNDFYISLDKYELNSNELIMNDYEDWNPDFMISRLSLFSIFGRYYIGKFGIVPFWHPMHKKIKAKFKELKTKALI